MSAQRRVFLLSFLLGGSVQGFRQKYKYIMAGGVQTAELIAAELKLTQIPDDPKKYESWLHMTKSQVLTSCPNPENVIPYC